MKITKYNNELTGQEITLTVKEKLNNIDIQKAAPQKQAEVNEILRKLKTPLPK